MGDLPDGELPVPHEETTRMKRYILRCVCTHWKITTYWSDGSASVETL